MSSDFEDKPFSESHLDSPEYRKRLLRKLNTLIAVLEVACAKVRRTLEGPDPDVERLTRIQNNLEETLGVCLRARKALQRCEELPEELGADLSKLSLAPPEVAAAPSGSSVELTGAEEESRFERLGPIDPREVRGVDLNELARQLSEYQAEE